MHDLVIDNALLVDGSGAPPRTGALAVSDGRIVAVGAASGDAAERIDAQGLALSPGFIDAHTHYDAQITWDPSASPSVHHGVTTILMGNCGFTIAPCKPADRELTLRNLTQVEGMSLEALMAGTLWEFETFPEYLAMLERLGSLPNLGVYCGHSSLRTWVMGADATERAATADEVERMASILREAMRTGAVGFATSTFEGHNGWGGVPMPSRLADEHEMRRLTAVLGEEGRGVYMLTKGKRTTVPFLESLAADSGRPVVIAAILFDHANPDASAGDMRRIEAANARGHRLVGQAACTPVTMDLRLDGFYAFEALAAWRPAVGLYGDHEKLAALYADAGFRATVKAELTADTALNRFTDQWHLFEIVKAGNPEQAPLEGRNIAELAAADGKDPLDWLLDHGIADGFSTLYNAQILNSDEDRVRDLITHPNAHVSLSDAGAHLSLFCDAGFATHLLGRWTRERGDFSLAQAVRAVTAVPAQIYGLKARGALVPGNYADLVLFNPDTIGRTPKQRRADLPAGAERLVTAPLGIEGVWVNGTRVMAGGETCVEAARPGMLIRDYAP